VEDLVGRCAAYLYWGTANPGHYRVVFGGRAPWDVFPSTAHGAGAELLAGVVAALAAASTPRARQAQAAADDGEGGAVARGDGLRLGRQRRGVEPERRRVVERAGEHLVHGHGEEVRDRVARHVQPDRVDEHDPADARRLQQRGLGGDPPSDGVADYCHVFQAKIL